MWQIESKCDKKRHQVAERDKTKCDKDSCDKEIQNVLKRDTKWQRERQNVTKGQMCQRVPKWEKDKQNVTQTDKMWQRETQRDV